MEQGKITSAEPDAISVLGKTPILQGVSAPTLAKIRDLISGRGNW